MPETPIGPATQPDPPVTSPEPPGDPRGAPQILYASVRSYLLAHEERRRQVPRAVLVGLLAGCLGVAFRSLLSLAGMGREALLRLAHGLPAGGILIPIAFSAAGAACAVWLVRVFAPAAAGSGIQHVEAVLHHVRGMRWQRILPVKFAGGLAAMGAGLALGREGPTIQMGGSVGQAISHWLHCTPRERSTLIASGAGAGLAAAFNAPIAGLTFVLEELQRDFAPAVLASAFAACVSADIVTRVLLGQSPSFHVGPAELPELESLPAFLALGLLAGLLGVAFNRGLLASLQVFRSLRLRPALAAAAAVGGVVAIVSWFAPTLVGGGEDLAQRALDGRPALGSIGPELAMRYLLTMGSYGCGPPGGIFAPMLALGAQLGLAIGTLGHEYLPGVVRHPQLFVIAGMAALFTAIVRAPITGVLLLIEMTGHYEQMLALLVASFGAYAVAELLRDRPIYQALLERDLAQSEGDPLVAEARVIRLRLGPAAPFAGRSVGGVDLPAGCVLLSVRRGWRTIAPDRDTRLRAGDRITAAIAAGSETAEAALREGCR